MPPIKETIQVNNPQQSPRAVNDSFLEDLRNLIKNKFASLEECIALAEFKITRQHEEDIGMLKVAERTSNTALDLSTSSSAPVAENTEKLTSHEFDHHSVLVRLVNLETDNRKIKEELEDT